MDVVKLIERVNALNGEVKFVGGGSPSLVMTQGRLSDEEFLNRAIIALEKLTADK